MRPDTGSDSEVGAIDIGGPFLGILIEQFRKFVSDKYFQTELLFIIHTRWVKSCRTGKSALNVLK